MNLSNVAHAQQLRRNILNNLKIPGSPYAEGNYILLQHHVNHPETGWKVVKTLEWALIHAQTFQLQ